MNKKICIFALGILFLFSPNLLPAQAATTPLETTITREQKIVLIQQLLEQVKLLQAQLVLLQKSTVPADTPVVAADYTRGNAKAQVQIVTYSDIDCPFCKVFHTTLDEVLANNPAVSVTFRHFPLVQLHPNAEVLAIAAECAGQIGGNGAFWSVLDTMFDSRSINEQTDVNKVAAFMNTVGISEEAFASCASGSTAKEAVKADIASGVALGVQGVPQSFVYKNGKLVKKINGAQPLASVQALIADLVK